MQREVRQLLMVLAALPGLLAGCAVGPPDVTNICEALQSENPELRVRAAVMAGNERDEEAVPLLVDRLSDIDPDVRLFSSMALRKITEKDFGWRAYAPRAERDQAIGRWRDWLKQRRREERERHSLPEPVS